MGGVYSTRRPLRYEKGHSMHGKRFQPKIGAWEISRSGIRSFAEWMGGWTALQDTPTGPSTALVNTQHSVNKYT
ncbi:hypothetical protein CC80DRAFT_299826 [Byssothecium circinans]|uniref:Uncharacterized protein n=1 Tax=Byssothecium circinans TaxID=147558 RepID=A0A6A5TA68_9PLEO|nr:hypothetical protein CC80DRAFT_315331 [Byssothecium circinans]KAF1948592.1 hypothetical protein CC80DRAFT_299826 [Byssothecium circinans]